ncbi:MAG: TonB-dependent receptor [Chitinophagales bacterium]|nr:TonB-dependent receptor [Chitinophagales bacterium]
MQIYANCSTAFLQEQKNKKQSLTGLISYSATSRSFKKILLTFQLCTILIFGANFKVNAEERSSNVNLTEKHASFRNLFSEPGKQIWYANFCSQSFLKSDGIFSIDLEDKIFLSVPDEYFTEQNLTSDFFAGNSTDNENEIKVTTETITTRETSSFIEIKGQVVNYLGEPLSGASIIVKGTDIGTKTDVNGYFTINTELNATLLISFVGYSSIEVVVNKRNLGKLILNLSGKINDEVVIVGYGKVQRKNLTSAISSVKASDVVKSTELSLNTALQGRAAGVLVTSSEGDPGAPVSITIRAGSSISASNEPLYVINGFPQLGGSNFNINPNDIETIDILKDASAAAYGSRGANGVIIITTKSGKAGRFTIEYNAYVSTSKIARPIKLLNVAQYAELQHQLQMDGTFGDTSIFKNWRTFKDSSSVDWYKSTFRTGVNQSHNLSLSGGTESVKVVASFGYDKQQGVAINNDFHRYTVDLNINSRLNKIVSNETVIYLTQRDKTGPNLSGSSQVMYSVIKASPFLGYGVTRLSEFLDRNLRRGGIYGTDPVEALTVDKRFYEVFNGSINTAFNFNLTKNLVLRLAGGVHSISDQYSTYYPSTSGNGQLQNGEGSISIGKDFSWLSENTLNYNKTFADKHTVDFTTGFTLESGTSKSYGFGSHQFPIDVLGYDNLGFGTIADYPSSGKSKYSLASYLGILRYNYLSKYLLTVIMRADGSSKFPNHRWGYFPSTQAAWKIKEENFMNNIKQISSLKLRVSWGMVGNESVPSYSSLTRYSNFSRPPVMNQTSYPLGLAPISFGVGDLKWETNIQTNIGLDLGLFDDRLLLTVDAYKKKSKDLLLAAPISYYSGYSEVYRNVGDIQVKGMEINLNTINVKSKKFTWNSNFNIAFNRGKVLALSDNQESFQIQGYKRYGGWIVKVGEPLGNFYGWVFDGYINTDEELYTEVLPHDMTPIRSGARKYKDVNGDGVVDSDDRAILGNGNPDFFGGFNNEFRYGQFELSFLFTFSYGNKIFNTIKNIYERPGGLQGGPVSMYNHWTQLNPQINAQLWNSSYDTEYDYTTSYSIEDGSYFRLKNVQLGYNISTIKGKRLPFNRLRVYASAQNLLTFTRYTGYDPEVNFKNSIITPGMDYGAYPRSRMFTFGINVSF